MLPLLPEEILVHHIFPNLGIVSKIRLLVVCKKFCKLRQKVDPDDEIAFWTWKVKSNQVPESVALAIEKNDMELVKVLEPLCDSWMLAVEAAAAQGDLDLVKYYAAKYPGGMPDEVRSVACGTAIRKGHHHVLKYFLDQGVQLTVQHSLSAALAGNLDLVQQQDLTGHLMCHLEAACRGAHKQVVEWLLSKGASIEPNALFAAALGGNKEIVEMIIAKGANQWNDALFAATFRGHSELQAFFIEKGADEEIIEQAQKKRKRIQQFLWKYCRLKIN